jgi:curved DNA-binding protein CbpA
MIRTLLAGQEYIISAKLSGVYPHLLGYISRVESGQRPAALPGEMAMSSVAQQHPQQQQRALDLYPQQAQKAQTQIVTHTPPAPVIQQRPSAHVMKGRRNEKALNYFQKCLEVLGLEEEVALTEETLKKAYKRVALKAHPDKGGTEEDFEAITRAHAYLGEILLRVKGGRGKEGKVEAPEALQDNRKVDAKQWEMVQPVRLNPKKLDMNAFNQMFEQTRIPDPEEDGYGDWLKGADDAGGTGPKFGGKFNRDVFNRAFEEEAAKRRAQGQDITVRQPEALTLAPSAGVELGRGGGGSFTAAANASLKFTDLKNAYTSDNMITTQVAGVTVEARSFDKYSSSRKQAPAPLTDQEMAGVMAAEAAAARREEQRRLRAAQEDSMGSQYFERMKRLVITNK